MRHRLSRRDSARTTMFDTALSENRRRRGRPLPSPLSITKSVYLKQVEEKATAFFSEIRGSDDSVDDYGERKDHVLEYLWYGMKKGESLGYHQPVHIPANRVELELYYVMHSPEFSKRCIEANSARSVFERGHMSMFDFFQIMERFAAWLYSSWFYKDVECAVHKCEDLGLYYHREVHSATCKYLCGRCDAFRELYEKRLIPYKEDFSYLAKHFQEMWFAGEMKKRSLTRSDVYEMENHAIILEDEAEFLGDEVRRETERQGYQKVAKRSCSEPGDEILPHPSPPTENVAAAMAGAAAMVRAGRDV